MKLRGGRRTSGRQGLAVASALTDVRERILVEILTNGAMQQAEIQKRFERCDIRGHIQWLVDAALLESSGSSDDPVLARGKRLGPGQ
jgi:hypothetical protein